jgi:tetratricopeptide (TPR) repeat protein
MRTIHFAILLLFALATTNLAQGQAADPHSDFSAGRISMRMTPCLLAAKAHQGVPCPEPQARNNVNASEQAADHIARARYFIDLQDLPSAAAETNAAIAADSTSTPAHHLSARLALTMGDKARAESEIAIARTEAPDDLDIHATYAAVLEARPAPTEALVELNAVIAQNPDHIYARLERSAIHRQHDNLRAALVDLNFLIDTDPHNAIYLAMRSDTFIRLGRAQDAVSDLTAALQINPRQFTLLADRARAYELAGDDNAALADLSTILGPVGGPPAYAVGGNQYARFLEQRAMILVHSHQLANAAADMMTAVTNGGRPAILRTQVLLRQNGFPEVPLDGKDSPQMRTAIEGCFGLDSCFAAIKHDI